MAESDLNIKIPVELLREFKAQPRVVIRGPWLIGIPVPDILRNQDIVKRFEKAGFELMFVPKKSMR